MLDRTTLPGRKVLVEQGISVDPLVQSKGVGSMLIDYSVKIAEKNGSWMWVHLSSDPRGARAFEKAGFVTADDLVVKLDDYRTKPLPEGREEWGIYTWRCRVRAPTGH